jgi:thiamine-phosphate pyrophosphorylase
MASEIQTAGAAALALHLRLPSLSGRVLYEAARSASEAAAAAGGWCVVNSRPDIALAAGAQGVQLGRTAVGPERVSRWVAGRLRIGASVHGADQALRAARNGANYVVLGTIFATPTHPGRAAAGLSSVARCRAVLDDAGFGHVGLVAIGGIDAARARAVREAGADGLAVVRAVWEAADPVLAARQLIDG